MKYVLLKYSTHTTSNYIRVLNWKIKWFTLPILRNCNLRDYFRTCPLIVWPLAKPTENLDKKHQRCHICFSCLCPFATNNFPGIGIIQSGRWKRPQRDYWIGENFQWVKALIKSTDAIFLSPEIDCVWLRFNGLQGENFFLFLNKRPSYFKIQVNFVMLSIINHHLNYRFVTLGNENVMYMYMCGCGICDLWNIFLL